MRDPAHSSLQKCLAHDCLVRFVAAWRGQPDWPEWDPARSSLEFDQLAAHGVHANAACGFVERRQETDHISIALLSEDVQRPCAVLARTPREQYALRGHGDR